MRFHFEQTIHAPSEDVAEAFIDPRYYDELRDLPKFGCPQVLRRRKRGAVVYLDVRYRYAGLLASSAGLVLDPGKLTWVQHSVHNLATRLVRFRVVPDHYRDRLNSSGSFALLPDGDNTRWVIDGDLAVALPFNGAAAERAIVSGLARRIAREVGFVEKWISGQR